MATPPTCLVYRGGLEEHEDAPKLPVRMREPATGREQRLVHWAHPCSPLGVDRET